MAIREQTFTIQVVPDVKGKTNVFYSGEEAALARAHDLGDIIQYFAKDMPGRVNITFTKHDQPACQLGWEHKNKMIELAAEGECELVFSCLLISPLILV